DSIRSGLLARRSPRLTKIQPSEPRNCTPLGALSLLTTPRSCGVLSSRIVIVTPLAYLHSIRYFAAASYPPGIISASDLPSNSTGPERSVPLPHCAMSLWCAPQSVIWPPENWYHHRKFQW